MMRARRRAGTGAIARAGGAALALLAAATVSSRSAPGGDAVETMIRRVLEAPQATAAVVLERSDPFGGPPEREQGRVWYIPGRGIRYRSEGKAAQEIAVDRTADRVVLYRPSEPRLYEGPWARAPLRLRQLVAEPEKVLRGASGATREARAIRGTPVEGWRLRSGSLGDSLGRVSVWVSSASSGYPRFVALANEVDTLLVEFRAWSVRREARPSDLDVRAPRGTPVSPLHPRDLLDGAGGGGSGESR